MPRRNLGLWAGVFVTCSWTAGLSAADPVWLDPMFPPDGAMTAVPPSADAPVAPWPDGEGPSLAMDAPESSDYPTILSQPALITSAEATPPAKPKADPQAKAKKLKKDAAGAYKPLFYDNQFDYLLDPAYQGSLLGEPLKRRCLGPWGVLDIGGEYRLRYHREQNIRGLGLTGRDDSFLLHRPRLYANAEVTERLRVYAEMIDALSAYEQFAPRAIEEDRTDLLNGFADVILWDDCGGTLGVRAGRQELLYGAQRTVSPLDWANTRRTFEGYKVFWKGEKWDVDGFWVRPVPPRTDRFDTPDQSQQFMGLYSTYKGLKKQTVDFYYLRLAEHDAPGFDFHTLGSRWEGSYESWLAEAEAGYQFGSFDGASHSAGAFTTGIGRKLGDDGWKPTLWLYYDWASGDDVLGNGYHHLFPLAHKYLGFMDLFGRRNIQDLNTLLTLQPCEKLKLLAWYHVFWLQDPNDVPYGVTMAPFVNTPGGSNELGHELDLLATFTTGPRSDLVLGYSHFFTGDFYRTNPTPPPFSGDANFYYVQYAVRF